MELATEPIGDRPPLREVVSVRIQRMITSGDLAPGERLVETALADQLGVSRGPVREAIQMLLRDGWVDQLPRRGTYVHTPTRREVDDFFEVRRLLEGYAAATAAQNGPSDEQLAPAEAIMAAAREAIARGDGDAIVELNSEFHDLITELADNEVLSTLTSFLSGRSRWFFAPLAKIISVRAWDEHLAIVEAIRAGDPEAARDAAHRHVEGARVSYHELADRR